MFSAIADGFGYLFGWMSDLFQWFMDGILWLLQPLLDLIGAIFYFIYCVGLVLIKVFAVVLTIGRLLIGLTTGLFKTITGLGIAGGSAPLPASYTGTFSKLQPIFAQLQIDKAAYVIHFAIWITAAFLAIKIIGGMRGGSS
ncbi:hypothetical protein [Paenibacillus alvei]|uniref:hypothetical protein n=1 Tax=Paenibacillus alvei TaxID=44250 RepID=UPI002280D772|nr:hypothetical protein [Paenibacillus alvei]MCY7486733.1 hypothetical protein [Paenibacillus alvei]